jgi:hypothetical protein
MHDPSIQMTLYRKMIGRLTLFIAILSAIVGCSTTEVSRAPNDGVNPSFAGVFSYNPDSTPRTTAFYPLVLDSVPIQYGMSSQIRQAKIYATPGTHRIVTKASFAPHPFGDVIYAIVVLEANLMAGHDYLITGKLVNDKIEAWLEDARTGERLPYSVSAKWANQPGSTVMPVIIPTR